MKLEYTNMSLLATCAIGLHLATVHIKDNGLNDRNPGVYASCSDVTVGVYHNSHRRTTVYGGYKFLLRDNVAMLAGVATGYGKLKFVLIPEVAIGGGWRLQLVPPDLTNKNSRGAIHLAYEF